MRGGVAAALLACACGFAVAFPTAACAQRPPAPEGPPQPAGVAAEALADSLAAAVLAAPSHDAGGRMATFQRLAPPATRPFMRAVADTLGEDLLIAVQALPAPGVALRVVRGSEARRVEGAARAAGPVGMHALRRVTLAQVRPLYEQPLTRVALAWFEEPGDAPFALWVAPVDSVPGASPGLHRTAAVSSERGGDGGLRVLSRSGETLLAVRERGWTGAASVDAGLCAECPRLAQETTWRVDGVTATRLRVEPVDDAAWAVARAFDARRGYTAWPAADVTVSPDVDRWMKVRRWAVLHQVLPLGGDDARVLLSSRGPADSLGVVVRRTARGAARGWSVTAGR